MKRPIIEPVLSPTFTTALEPKHKLALALAAERVWGALQYGLRNGDMTTMTPLVSMRTVVRLAIGLLEDSECFDYWDLVNVEDEIRAAYYAKTGKALGRRVLPIENVDNQGKPMGDKS